VARAVEHRGPTIDEAVQSALDELGVTEKDVRVEVLDEHTGDGHAYGHRWRHYRPDNGGHGDGRVFAHRGGNATRDHSGGYHQQHPNTGADA